MKEIIIYQTSDKKTEVEVRVDEESVWLTQQQIADLFNQTKQNISLHINNLYKERELKRSSTVKESLTVQIEGKRQISRMLDYYNLDVVISVGYRVKSKRGIQFIDHFYSNLFEFSAEHYPEAHQYFTPKEVALLLSSLIETKSMDSVFDPYCRSGNILFSVNHKLKSKKNAVGQARNSISYQVAKINSLMTDPTVEIEKTDHDSFVDLGEKYDIIVTNPPFGQMVFDAKTFLHSQWDSFGINRYESAFLVHGLNHLSDRGQFAIILPQAFLSTTGKTLMLRKKLLDDNVLEAVVTLPPKIFFNTNIASCILVLNRNKKTKKVLFFNASTFGKTENYRRVLQQDEIETIVGSLQEFRRTKAYKPAKGLSKILTFNEIEDRGYDLNIPGPDTDLQMMPNDLEAPDEILHEIKGLYKQLSDVRGKIDSLLFEKGQ